MAAVWLKTPSAICPMELASTIFLARPKQKRVMPEANSGRFSSRWAISAMTVV